MKKDLLIVPTYISVTLFLTFILAVFFVLYPLPTIGDVDYSIYLLDVFLYSALFILPMMAVPALVIVILRAIKYDANTMFSFLTYVFLCLSIWLLVIPLFLFFTPERMVSFLLTGKDYSIAAVFFDSASLSQLNNYLEVYSIQVSNSVLAIFSDLLFLRDMALEAGKNGRIAYLVFASIGFALSSLYALRHVSKWKLINVAWILFLWAFIIWINVRMYRNEWELYVGTEWSVFIINVTISLVVIILGSLLSAKFKKIQNKGL